MKGHEKLIEASISGVLTPAIYSRALVEFIKYVALQRCQIPYDYTRLKYIVERRKNMMANAQPGAPLTLADAPSSRSYFLAASSAVEMFELTFQNIIKEFESDDIPEELCVVLGPNIISAKEIYRVKIPPTVSDHHNSSHDSNIQNDIRKVLRSLVSSNDMQKSVSEPLSLTNMYVLLKKNRSRGGTINSEYFINTEGLRIPLKSAHTIINVNYDPFSLNCCKRMTIFNDTTTDVCDKTDGAETDQGERFEYWCRAEKHLKGFKSLVINGQCVSNYWL